MIVMHTDPPASYHITTPMNKIVLYIIILMGAVYKQHPSRPKMLLICFFRGHLVGARNIEHVEGFYIFSKLVPRITVRIKFAMFFGACKRVNSIY